MKLKVPSSIYKGKSGKNQPVKLKTQQVSKQEKAEWTA